MIAQISGNAWTQIIIALSIFVPVAVALAITIAVLRGTKDDPDEQRWKRLAEQQRESKRD